MAEQHLCMVDRRQCTAPELLCMAHRHPCMMEAEPHITADRRHSTKLAVAVPLRVEAVPGTLLMLIHPTGR